MYASENYSPQPEDGPRLRTEILLNNQFRRGHDVLLRIDAPSLGPEGSTITVRLNVSTILPHNNGSPPSSFNSVLLGVSQATIISNDGSASFGLRHLRILTEYNPSQLYTPILITTNQDIAIRRPLLGDPIPPGGHPRRGNQSFIRGRTAFGALPLNHPGLVGQRGPDPSGSLEAQQGTFRRADSQGAPSNTLSTSASNEEDSDSSVVSSNHNEPPPRPLRRALRELRVRRPFSPSLFDEAPPTKRNRTTSDSGSEADKENIPPTTAKGSKANAGTQNRAVGVVRPSTVRFITPGQPAPRGGGYRRRRASVRALTRHSPSNPAYYSPDGSQLGQEENGRSGANRADDSDPSWTRFASQGGRSSSGNPTQSIGEVSTGNRGSRVRTSSITTEESRNRFSYQQRLVQTLVRRERDQLDHDRALGSNFASVPQRRLAHTSPPARNRAGPPSSDRLRLLNTPEQIRWLESVGRVKREVEPCTSSQAEVEDRIEAEYIAAVEASSPVEPRNSVSIESPPHESHSSDEDI